MSLLEAHTDLRMPIGFDLKCPKTPFTPGGTAEDAVPAASEEPAVKVVGAAEDAAPAAAEVAALVVGSVLREPQSRGSVAWTRLKRAIISEM